MSYVLKSIGLRPAKQWLISEKPLVCGHECNDIADYSFCDNRLNVPLLDFVDYFVEGAFRGCCVVRGCLFALFGLHGLAGWRVGALHVLLPLVVECRLVGGDVELHG